MYKRQTMHPVLRHISCRIFWHQNKQTKKHQITQVTQPHYSPDLVPYDFWLFPKLKSPLKRKRFQTIDKIKENTNGAANGNWENCVRSYFEGDRGIVVPCTVFLVSSLINVSIFHITWLDTS